MLLKQLRWPGVPIPYARAWIVAAQDSDTWTLKSPVVMSRCDLGVYSPTIINTEPEEMSHSA